MTLITILTIIFGVVALVGLSTMAFLMAKTTYFSNDDKIVKEQKK